MDDSTLPRFLNLAALPPGFRLRDLILDERIGKGGFGVVYKAHRGERVFALKLPLMELGSTNEEARQRALRELPRVDREISSLKSLKHPNVITVVEFFTWNPLTDEVGDGDGIPIIVMPFIDGPPLDTWVQQQRPSLRTILGALRDIASALSEVHKRNFVHRDLKPSNILVDSTGRPVLIDFGIAKGKSAYTQTSKATTIGTIEYFAPEYVAYCLTKDFRAGKPFLYSPAQDFYALGHAIYQSLTGCGAWAAYNDVLHSELTLELLEVLKSGVIPPPSDLNPALPEEVDAIIFKLLARTPRGRFQSGQELLEAIEAVLNAHPPPHALLDVPFTLPTQEEREKRVRESSERILAEELPEVASPGVPSEPTAPLPAPEAAPTANAKGLPLTASNVLPGAPTAPTLPPPPPPTTTLPSVVPGASPASGETSRQRPAAANSPSPTVGQRQPPGGVDPQPAFRTPTIAQAAKAFEAPVEQQPQAAVAPDEAAPALPSAITRLRDELAEASGKKTRFPAWALAGVGLVVALLLFVALSNRASRPASPTSLIDAAEKEGVGGAPPPAVQSAPLPTPAQSPPGAAEAPKVEPTPAKAAGNTRPGAPRNADAKDVDELLAREYGGKHPVVPPDGQPAAPGAAQPAAPPLPAYAMRAVSNSGAPAQPTGPRKLGIPLGSEIAVRLTKPLDSRISGSVVVARLQRAFALRGELILPTGTFVYGTAQASGAGRLDVKLVRLKFPDGTEVPFSGIGFDVSDKKPGLTPSRRITAAPTQGPNVVEQVAKGAANTALAKVAGNDAADLARGAGQTVLNQQGAAQQAAQDALLLDAPTDFNVFVAEAF